MGNVYQTHISASQKQLLQDSSHGFILKRNVRRLTWRRERREAGSITQSLYAYSGSPCASLEITGTSTWLSELRRIYFSSCFFFPLQAYGFGCWDRLSVRACSFQHTFIQSQLFRSCEVADRTAVLGFLLSKAKKTEGLSWGVMSSKKPFLLEKYLLGWFDVHCLNKLSVCIDKKEQQESCWEAIQHMCFGIVR